MADRIFSWSIAGRVARSFSNPKKFHETAGILSVKHFSDRRLGKGIK